MHDRIIFRHYALYVSEIKEIEFCLVLEIMFSSQTAVHLYQQFSVSGKAAFLLHI